MGVTLQALKELYHNNMKMKYIIRIFIFLIIVFELIILGYWRGRQSVIDELKPIQHCLVQIKHYGKEGYVGTFWEVAWYNDCGKEVGELLKSKFP